MLRWFLRCWIGLAVTGASAAVAGAVEPPASTASPETLHVYPDRSYYTSEDKAIVVVETTVPDKATGSGQLALKDAAGAVLAQAITAPEVRLPVALGNLSLGRHPLTVEWSRPGAGNVTAHLELIKRAPGQDHEWKVDQINRNLLKDGHPFFSISVCYAVDLGSRAPNSLRDRYSDQIKQVGADTCLIWSRWYSHRDHVPEGPLADVVPNILVEYARVAAAKDLFLAIPIMGLGEENLDALWRTQAATKTEHDRRFREGYEKAISPTLAAIRAVKEQRNIIGYYTFDQPGYDLYLKCGADLYARVKAEDPYRIIFTDQNIHTMNPELVGFRDAFTGIADVLGRNVFINPVQAALGYESIIEQATGMERVSRRTRQPVWIFLTAAKYSRVNKRALTIEEHFCQAYLALICGAKGVQYWRTPLDHQQNIDNLARVITRIRRLAPMVMAPSIPHEVRYETIDGEPPSWAESYPTDADRISIDWGRPPTYLVDDNFPDTPAALFRNPQGGSVILVVNRRIYPVDVRIHVSTLSDEGLIRRLFSDEEHACEAGAFQDRLERYGVRAYVLPDRVTSGKPVSITLTAKPYPEQAVLEPFLPPRGRRPGQRNILCNAGFEDSTVPGCPDYFYATYAIPEMGGQEPAGWGQDKQNPYEGTTCLRVVDQFSRKNGFRFLCVPQHDKPTPYIFSVYLRSERDGVKVRLDDSGGFLERKDVVLTTRWKRYWTRGVIPADCRRNLARVRVLSTGGSKVAFWADAVRVEQGDEPTAFDSGAAADL